MEKPYVCRKKGCTAAKQGVKYAAQHLVMHYLHRHSDYAEGKRQLKLQKKLLVKNLGESLGTLDPDNQMADLGADGATTDHVADELVPGAGEVHEVVGQIGDVVVSENTESFLNARITRLKAESSVIQSKLGELNSQMDTIVDELTRTMAAKAAWDAAVKPKVRTAGGSNNPDDDSGYAQ